MLELYLITRIGIINDVAAGLFCATAIGLILIGILVILSDGDIDEDHMAKIERWGKRLYYGLIVSALVAVITPNEKDLYLIYGVGGIVDYIQTNDKAKQLPDECVNALINWTNNLNEKKEK